MILTQTQTKRLSIDDGGEMGIICFTSNETWNKLNEVEFTLRSDFDNVLLESVFRDKTEIEQFKGVDFKFATNGGYSYTREYKQFFDYVDGEYHLESKKGWESFNKFLAETFPEDIDEAWNRAEYEKYTSGLSKDGHLYRLEYDRMFKTFLFATEEQFKKLANSVDGLKVNPLDYPGRQILFEYSVGMMSPKEGKELYFLDEWLDAMRQIPA